MNSPASARAALWPWLDDATRARARRVVIALLGVVMLTAMIRAEWNLAAHGNSDFEVFAAAARLLAAHSPCIYSHQCLGLAESAYIGGPLPGGVAPYLNPPLAAALLIPLAALPPLVGQGIFLMLLLAAIAGTWWLLRGLGAPGFVTWVALASYSASTGVARGQWDPLLVLALAGSLTQLRRRPVVAGLLLSCLLIKIQVGWLVPFALLGMRQWRVLGGYAAGAATLVVSAPLLIGSHSLDAVSAMLQAGTGEMASSDGLPGMVALIGGSGAGWWSFCLLAPVAALLTYRLARRADEPALMLAAAVALSLCLATHVLPPDLILLAPVLGLSARRWNGPALGCAALLSVPWLTLQNPAGNSPFPLAMPIATLSCTFLALLAVEAGQRLTIVPAKAPT